MSEETDPVRRRTASMIEYLEAQMHAHPLMVIDMFAMTETLRSILDGVPREVPGFVQRSRGDAFVNGGRSKRILFPFIGPV